ncbi:Catenin alpha-2 [Merluccius polli]|uniref:Catenin alpha-2 n=1 Tax=Merluccius polli TaxID=89951 RepID=A0AA47N0U9_MERPO|nr:Catenin alpha-2 [Merluccius polli]
MASVLDHGLMKTAALEQVVAPIAGHLCLLVLWCETAQDPERFSLLEGAAQAVARATDNLASVASRLMEETEDDVTKMEMSALLEPVAMSGRHVLLVAQKLSIQPSLAEHREELITATQNVLLGVVKVLLVSDDATVRRIVVAAAQVLECLSQLGSSPDIKTLLQSFQGFSDALLLLHGLTVERANSLQDPRQAKSLLDSLGTLSKCISMLHTAMCTTIKHPSSEQAQAAKMYILDKVESTVKEIIETLNSSCNTGSDGPYGFYTGRRNSLLKLLDAFSIDLLRSNGLDSMVRDLVFHCMLVANSSRSNLQRRVVLDAFLSVSALFEELGNVREILDVDSPTDLNLDLVQPLLEDFVAYTDRLIQVAHFVSAMAFDAKSMENVENSCICLTRLRAWIASFSLELGDDPQQTVHRLQELCERWEEESSQLLDALSDVVDVREFTSVAISEMVNDRRGCDEAYQEQNYQMFTENASHFNCHLRQVVDSVKRHLDRSDNPIYRNGLLVLLKQVRTAQTKVEGSVREMLAGPSLNAEVYPYFSDHVTTALQHLKVLREGLDGQQHPHLLSPLREDVRVEQVVSPPPSPEPEELLDRKVQGNDDPLNVGFLSSALGRDLETEPQGEESTTETVEAAAYRKYDRVDLMVPAVSDKPTLIHRLEDFDLLPLLYEVVTVTKGKDVTGLNQVCTAVLELSNCYIQAAKEASSIVDAIDSQSLDDFRAELVSLTPLLVQTAQENAMSSAMSTEAVYKHCVHFSDLINNMRRMLLPVAGSWYHAIHALVHDTTNNMAATVAKQLSEVISLSADVVQLLTRSDVTTHSDGKESFNVLHNKLNKAQNNTRLLAELSSTLKGPVDQLEGPCLLWALSMQILLKSLDKILGPSSAVSQLTVQKKLSTISENSLRIQEAARLTCLICKSAYKAKQLNEIKGELKILTDNYLQVVEDFSLVQSVVQLTKSEFFQRKLLIKLRVLCGQLSKANKDYVTAIQNIVNIADLAAKHITDEKTAEEAEQQFETAAQQIFNNIKSATNKVEDCLNYVRDPRTRSNLRSINDHLSFQISDIVSRARLIVETRFVFDSLSLEVQIQCWSAKARYVTEEILKTDGIQQEAKDHIRMGLQGTVPEDASGGLAPPPCDVKEGNPPTATAWPKSHEETLDAATMGMSEVITVKEDYLNRHDKLVCRETSSLAYTSLFLKQETESWDPKDNRIVQVTRQMADKIYYMTQYLRRKGPIANKEAFVSIAKEVISNCQSVTQFVRVIANHCLDKQCTVELSLIVEQILTITNQLSIISSVNAVTPGCKSSDEILVKNAQNLLKTGLRQPEPNSDGAEAAALCFQWRKNLQIHRAQQNSNPETDDLGLRKTSPLPLAPSLAPSSLKIQ